MECKVCAERDEDNFYKGIGTYCKEHWKEKVRLNRANNISHYVEYDRERGMRPDRVEMRRKYQETEAGKASLKRAHDKYKKHNPEKRAAHILLGNAVAQGRVEKPDNCSMCKATGWIHGHHEDYMKPLDVIWVCAACHTKIHKF